MEIITLSGGPAPFDGQRRENSDPLVTKLIIPTQTEDKGLVFHEWHRVDRTSTFAYAGTTGFEYVVPARE